MSPTATRGRRNSVRTAGRRSSRRWRRSTATDLFPPACVVVNAGTAVTIDALDVDGVFRGGLILPGLRLMLQALAENTSAPQGAAGRIPAFPDNTGGRDLLRRGAGGLRRDRADAAAEIDADPAHVRCYLAGGAAPRSRCISTRRSR